MVMIRLIVWIRLGRKNGFEFRDLKSQLLKKRNSLLEVDEAIEYVKDEERKKRWLFALLGIVPLLVILITLFLVLSLNDDSQIIHELRGSGGGIVEDVEEPLPAPIINDTEVVKKKTYSGGGGGGGGSSSPAPEPILIPELPVEPFNETAINQTIPGNETELTNETELDLCENIVCESYCDGATNMINGLCSEGVCEFEDVANSEECGYEEENSYDAPINTTKAENYGFDAVMDATFVIVNDGDEQTIQIMRNSSGVINSREDSLYQMIKSYVVLKDVGESALAESETYRMQNNLYYHLMFNGFLDQWIRITPETNKGLLNQIGISPDYLKDRSMLEDQFEIINDTAFLPIGGDVCNKVFLGKKKPANKFMEVINRLIIWPISKLKYRFGVGYVVSDLVNEGNCHIKIIPDNKIAGEIAESLFVELANSSDAMAERVGFNKYNFAYKKALKDFSLEYEIDNQSRIVRVIMESGFDFNGNMKQKDDNSEDKEENDSEEVVGETDSNGNNKRASFNIKAHILVITDISYGEYSKIVVPEEALNAPELGEFLDSLDVEK